MIAWNQKRINQEYQDQILGVLYQPVFFKVEEFFTSDIVFTGDDSPECTCDWQIGLPLRGPPILFITRMITDRIGLHSLLLPLTTTITILSNVIGA